MLWRCAEQQRAWTLRQRAWGVWYGLLSPPLHLGSEGWWLRCAFGTWVRRAGFMKGCFDQLASARRRGRNLALRRTFLLWTGGTGAGEAERVHEGTHVRELETDLEDVRMGMPVERIVEYRKQTPLRSSKKEDRETLGERVHEGSREQGVEGCFDQGHEQAVDWVDEGVKQAELYGGMMHADSAFDGVREGFDVERMQSVDWLDGRVKQEMEEWFDDGRKQASEESLGEGRTRAAEEGSYAWRKQANMCLDDGEKHGVEAESDQGSKQEGEESGERHQAQLPPSLPRPHRVSKAHWSSWVCYSQRRASWLQGLSVASQAGAVASQAGASVASKSFKSAWRRWRAYTTALAPMPKPPPPPTTPSTHHAPPLHADRQACSVSFRVRST